MDIIHGVVVPIIYIVICIGCLWYFMKPRLTISSESMPNLSQRLIRDAVIGIVVPMIFAIYLMFVSADVWIDLYGLSVYETLAIILMPFFLVGWRAKSILMGYMMELTKYQKQ